MNTLSSLFRSVNAFKINHNLYIATRQCTSQKDDADPKSPKKPNKASDKLNLLLKQMIENDVVINSSKKLDLARPKGRKTIEKPVTARPAENKIVDAVKDVARTLGGNAKQTESELLLKLLNSTTKSGDNAPVSASLSEIIQGMKIDQGEKQRDVSRASQVKSILQMASHTPEQENKPRRSYQKNIQRDRRDGDIQREKVDLFGSEPLGIFTVGEKSEGVVNSTWEKLHARELRLAVTHPPSNYLQQMILWTEQGKIWKFPIDNEQDMQKERDVYFTEHVFLEKHLEQWCPSRGPVRHFMELVCVGLSKNPYMSVEVKKGHIEWYKEYFKDKQSLLQEVGAIPTNNLIK